MPSVVPVRPAEAHLDSPLTPETRRKVRPETTGAGREFPGIRTQDRQRQTSHGLRTRPPVTPVTPVNRVKK